MLEKSTESIVDGEKDKHIDHREHQTGMDTGVNGEKGCIKLLWTRGESRRNGRWRDARENEWSEKERKTDKEMAGHTQGVCERMVTCRWRRLTHFVMTSFIIATVFLGDTDACKMDRRNVARSSGGTTGNGQLVGHQA